MSDASEVSLPPLGSHQFRDPSRRFLWIVIALLGLILVGVFSARPAWSWFRTRRAHGLIAEAEKARNKGDWEAVGRAVQVVLRLAPHDPGVLRLVARYCAHYGAPSPHLQCRVR